MIRLSLMACIVFATSFNIPYHRITYRTPSEHKAESSEYSVGRNCADKAHVYHRLHHFVYNISSSCNSKVHMLLDSQNKVLPFNTHIR